jgi:hypothetical protein
MKVVGVFVRFRAPLPGRGHLVMSKFKLWPTVIEYLVFIPKENAAYNVAISK